MSEAVRRRVRFGGGHSFRGRSKNLIRSPCIVLRVLLAFAIVRRFAEDFALGRRLVLRDSPPETTASATRLRRSSLAAAAKEYPRLPPDGDG
jgi:hypothetical protein